MLKYILMILGGVIFIAGYYFMQQNEGRGKTMMFYSLFTYAGLTLVILSGARVLDPFFEGLGENGEMIQLAVEVACFVIGAELLLKPAFEDQKEIGTKKNITPRGSGDSFSAKANKKESTNYLPSTILSNFLVNANMITPQATMMIVTTPYALMKSKFPSQL